MKIVINILKVSIIVILVSWMTLFVIDYFRAKGNTKPLVCLKDNTKTNANGTYYECISFGYKYFEYNGSDRAPSYGFGPMFIKNEFEKNWEE